MTLEFLLPEKTPKEEIIDLTNKLKAIENIDEVAILNVEDNNIRKDTLSGNELLPIIQVIFDKTNVAFTSIGILLSTIISLYKVKIKLKINDKEVEFEGYTKDKEKFIKKLKEQIANNE